MIYCVQGWCTLLEGVWFGVRWGVECYLKSGGLHPLGGLYNILVVGSGNAIQSWRCRLCRWRWTPLSLHQQLRGHASVIPRTHIACSDSSFATTGPHVWSYLAPYLRPLSHGQFKHFCYWINQLNGLNGSALELRTVESELQPANTRLHSVWICAPDHRV